MESGRKQRNPKPKAPRKRPRVILPVLPGHIPTAEFSPCQLYRFLLGRQWDSSKPTVLFVGLNPSYASLDEDDRTIRKCQEFAKRWGYGKYLMGNLFGFRSTDPKGLLTVADPNGEGNDAAIVAAAQQASLIVVAWGANKMVKHREAAVLALLKNPMCLRYTKDGHPEHPLYVPYDTELIPYIRKPT